MSKITHGFWPASEGGAPRDYIECRLCNRVQSIRTPRASSGMTIPVAKSLGWTALGERWQCPICGKPKN